MDTCIRLGRKKWQKCWIKKDRVEGKQMKTKKAVRKIYDTINYSKKLKISSILPDPDSDQVILLELQDGSKFEIIVIPTRKFV